MANILLNEGTEIQVKENRAEIKKLISEKVGTEKMPYKGVDFHFIEVTRIVNFTRKEDGEKSTKEIVTDLYYKRILFIYD